MDDVKKVIESCFAMCNTENEVEELTGDIINIIFDVSDNRIYELNNK